MQGDVGVSCSSRTRVQTLLTPTESGLQQLIRFGLAGAVATVADYAVLLSLFAWAHVCRPLSVGAGYGVGLVVCYVFSIYWIFPHRNIADRRLEFILFVIIGVVGLGLTEVIVHMGVLLLETQRAAAMYLSDTTRLAVAKFVSVVLVFFFIFGARKATLFKPPKNG